MNSPAKSTAGAGNAATRTKIDVDEDAPRPVHLDIYEIPRLGTGGDPNRRPAGADVPPAMGTSARIGRPTWQAQ